MTTLASSTTTSTTYNDLDLASVSSFVRSVKERLVDGNTSCDANENGNDSFFPHLVIGNEAGDADSILSAIGLAYVRSLQNHHNNNDNNNDKNDNEQPLIVPIVSIPSDSLKFLRPETTFLLSDCAGIDNVKDDVNDLIAIDQTDLLPKTATLTLVDHNHGYEYEYEYEWTVTEIVDHHLDEGKHTETCPLSKRTIAFEGAQALVASTTTLVAEDFYATTRSNNNNNNNNNSIAMPPSLAILLLGTILLDSVNMSPQAGKGTPRDAAMIERLLADTDWSGIDLPEQVVTTTTGGDGDDDSGTPGTAPDPDKLFDHLQGAKFSPEFWSGLTAEQAIRMDFKSFSVPGTGTASSSPATASSIGLASILLEMNEFFELHEASLLGSVARAMGEDRSELLGLMFSTFGAKRRRQLALASYDKPMLDRLIRYLAVESTTTPDLQVEILQREEGKIPGNEETLYVVRMEQGNVKASRKQVAPILMDFFKKDRGSV
eukprot:jgi/Psemu1/230075/e_gw1.2986.1.1